MDSTASDSIYEYSPDELKEWLLRQGVQPFRYTQIYQWLYRHNAASFAEMSNLPVELRERLSRTFQLRLPEIQQKQIDSADGTMKLLLQLPDGEGVETVLMPRYESDVKTDLMTGRIKAPAGEESTSSSIKGHTVCLSTQVGCMFACRFCASGKLGLSRNMTAGEILSQIITLIREGHEISRIVFMGTGEPLHNLDAMRKAIEILCSKEGFGYSPRRITVSTVGLVPEIYRIAKEGWKIKLAVSLHATSDEKRAELMPLGRVYRLDQLKDALRYYQRANGRRITFEYLMMDRTNDSQKDAERLATFCEGLACHVNLIPYNAIGQGEFRPSSSERIQQFKKHLLSKKIDATVRYSRGRNIDAACGQLRLRHAVSA